MPGTPGSDKTNRALVVLAAATALAVAGYAATATMLLVHSSPDTPDPAKPRALPAASPPVWIQPAPSDPAPGGIAYRGAYPLPTATRAVRAGAGTAPGPVRSRSATATPRSASPRASSAVPRTSSKPPGIVAGTTVGLGLPNLPGYRLRHRNFVARVDVITASSSELDRMDSRFVVRASHAVDRCLSFESVNYPGYFLRYRDFALRLDEAPGSGGFDRDAGFCPVAVDGGTALRSADDPERYLVLFAGTFRLEQIPLQLATRFTSLAPL
ncbi:hypothetical protein ACTI_45810 [Actinoplanes sp. OR16]|uniref:AbfB domain-containing protein n=1 Tax=Actinoplanes sp. OR16 TaxID=946334 RepID=UPI000F6D2B5F|nr:AbfB domain-containing protein [Actinoplanes sp. OR16]BBH67896.1 hypothetical protein ACTI_45810 [Actinoplanes sp. OR16]